MGMAGALFNLENRVWAVLDTNRGVARSVTLGVYEVSESHPQISNRSL